MASGSWIAVCVAGLSASCVLGVLVTRPVWGSGHALRGVPLLLAVQCGIAAVVGTVTVAAASRSWQLIEAEPTEQNALLEVSRIDGDGRMYALLVLALVAGTFLVVGTLALASRFAAGDDELERMMACVVLALELFASGFAAYLVLGGSRALPLLALAVQLPVLIAAMVRCWPPVAADLPRAAAR